MQGENDLILKGFKDSVICNTSNDAQEIFESVENPFRAKKTRCYKLSNVYILWSHCFKLFFIYLCI